MDIDDINMQRAREEEQRRALNIVSGNPTSITVKTQNEDEKE